MIDCLVRVEGFYVLNNNLCRIVVHCDVHAQRLIVTSKLNKALVYIFPWFNHWPGISETDRVSGEFDPL